jgi:hypothetical protein
VQQLAGHSAWAALQAAIATDTGAGLAAEACAGSCSALTLAIAHPALLAVRMFASDSAWQPDSLYHVPGAATQLLWTLLRERLAPLLAAHLPPLWSAWLCRRDGPSPAAADDLLAELEYSDARRLPAAGALDFACGFALHARHVAQLGGCAVGAWAAVAADDAEWAAVQREVRMFARCVCETRVRAAPQSRL